MNRFFTIISALLLCVLAVEIVYPHFDLTCSKEKKEQRLDLKIDLEDNFEDFEDDVEEKLFEIKEDIVISFHNDDSTILALILTHYSSPNLNQDHKPPIA